MSDDDDLDDALADSYGGRGGGDHDRDDGDGEEEGEGYEGEGYDDEDDFEPYEQETKLRQSPIVKPTQHHDDEEDIFGEEDTEQPVTSQEEENSQIDFEEQTMTLESYMEEFFKRKYQENPEGHSPEAVDPQVLFR